MTQPIPAGRPSAFSGPEVGRPERRTTLVLVAAATALALVNGLIFTFATAVMPGLAKADDAEFVAALQRYNDNPVFPITFTVALVVVIAATVVHLRHGPRRAARWTIIALGLYLLALIVTFAVNVPLNTEIDSVGDTKVASELAQVRQDIERPWVVFNLVRLLFATASSLALLRALVLHGHHTGRWSTPSVRSAKDLSPPKVLGADPVIVPADAWLDDRVHGSGSFEGRTAGASISVIANHLPPGAGVAAHRHPYAEVFVVRSGTVKLMVGNQPVTATAGQIVVAPPNIGHSFSNPGSEPAEMIDIHQHPNFDTTWL